ncbi:EF-P lysine aminoacylase EpmA [Granulosicoccus antarcticus]|uniref:Elongation factor P--(R)-beta-lysine ligase n=1 Tax=Granulosicoccus antarcticus IMCC3135 TaxID=1192854 RepID=A0A2Z2NUS1_9GAMM|nr:EF-P lysine aminoacylase EpmA [Granulosicoccus antarcticus]ASJ75246.1 Elongation factor P--(R)-beta-lysine ligase [Granulosicoccus antarcticus IMCC3135]
MNWRPGASLSSLREAALLRRSIHAWMELQGVLEVQTPALSGAAATDPHVLSIRTDSGRFLHTSPEFPMKRLLAAHACEIAESGSLERQPDLYQIATVFRAEESGRFHNTEFTLLEWYRVGMDHVELMADLETLLQSVWQAFGKSWPGVQSRRYGEEVHRLLGVWPEQMTSTDTIADYFAAADRSYPEAIATDVDAALDLFMDEFVLPEFAPDAFTLLVDYPASQSALARLGQDDQGREVAQRFELYFGQVELANGFHELSDAATQRVRFESDLLKRERLGVASVPVDEHLLDALSAGLPDCAGIALGLERLHMVLAQHEHIREVLSFDDQRA